MVSHFFSAPSQRSLKNATETISAADDSDLKLLDSLEHQKEEVEMNLHNLEIKRQKFEKAVEFSTTLYLSLEETKKLEKAEDNGDKGAAGLDMMDCFSCGQPISGKIFARHIEQCYAKKEGNAYSCSHKLNDHVAQDGTTIVYCNYYDSRTGSYCTRQLADCSFHLEKKKVCGSSPPPPPSYLSL